MQVTTTLSDQALLAAKHEFGHWSMAARLGFMPHDIEITITPTIFGPARAGKNFITLDEEMRNIKTVQYYIRRRIVVLFAGSFAESLSHDGKVDPQYAVTQLMGEAGSAKDDFSKIRELLPVLRGIKFRTPVSAQEHEEQLKRLQDPLWNRAGEIIEIDHEIVLGMAKAIASKVTGFNVPFGMTENQIRELPGIKKWLETVAREQLWLQFKL